MVPPPRPELTAEERMKICANKINAYLFELTALMQEHQHPMHDEVRAIFSDMQQVYFDLQQLAEEDDVHAIDP